MRRRRVRSMKAALDPRRAEEFRRAFEGEIKSLRDLYRQAASDMMRVLEDAAATPLTRARAIAHLRQYNTILSNLGDESAAWMQLHLPESYKVGVEFSNGNIGDLRRAGINFRRRQRDVFSQVHREAVAAIVQEMQRTTNFALAQIGRRAKDVFRRVGIEEVAKGIAEGKTRVEVSREIKARLLAEGKPVFKDALGREWELDRYAEMVARTTTREAASQGTVNRLREHGIQLAQVSSHQAADFCIYYEGVVVCIEGTHPVYPPISAINGGPPFHPNCRHVLTPFVEPLATDQEKAAGKIEAELLDRSPAQLQRRFRGEFPKRAQAEGRRARQEGALVRGRGPRAAPRRDYQPMTDATAREAFQGWRNSLTSGELEALRLYQTSAYDEWQAALRSGQVERAQRPWIAKVDRGIAKGTAPSDMIVYRGMGSKHLAGDLEALKGAVLTDKGFLSTSLDPLQGRKFASRAQAEGTPAAFCEIRVPKGTKAAYLGLTAPGEYIAQEQELLLSRGIQLRVVSATMEKDGIAHLVLEAVS